ncbi:hypothetical protein [Lacrimispora sp.]
MQKGDWHKALVDSIHKYLLEACCTTSWDQMAKDFADRLLDYPDYAREMR